MVIGIGFFVDQLTKFFAREYLSQSSVDFGLFRFDLVFNTGAAYGLFAGHTLILLFIGLAVIGYLIFSLKTLVTDRYLAVTYGVLIAGALGNTLDRLIFSQVTDFINIRIIPVFNVADVLLNIGLGLLILHYFLYERHQSKG